MGKTLLRIRYTCGHISKVVQARQSIRIDRLFVGHLADLEHDFLGEVRDFVVLSERPGFELRPDEGGRVGRLW